MHGLTNVGGFAILEDPTGTRVRWMRRAGRVVFALFLFWLIAIVLAGLGLIPAAGIPLAHVARPSQGPPPLAKLPTPRRPSVSDLRPALPASVFAAAAGPQQAKQVPLRDRPTIPAAALSPGKSASARGKTKTPPPSSATRGGSALAPGHTKTTPASGASPGKSASAPGKTKTTPALPAARGRSAEAPGHKKTTSPSVRKSKKP